MQTSFSPRSLILKSVVSVTLALCVCVLMAAF
jgi:hypothetical protein